MMTPQMELGEAPGVAGAARALIGGFLRHLVPSGTGRGFSLCALGAFALTMSACFALTPASALISFAPAALLAGVAFLWIWAAACTGNRVALIIYFAAIAFMTDAALRPRAAGATSADWQSLLKLALWLGGGVIGLAQLPPARRIIGNSKAVLVLAFLASCVFSASYAPSPGYTLGCAIALAALFAFAFALIRRLSEADILWTVVIVLTAFLIIGWIVYYKDPDLGASPFWTYAGMDYRMAGIAGQANNLGTICAIHLGALFLLWHSHRCKLVVAIPLAAVAVISIVASDARTAMIAVGVASIGVLLRRTPWALVGVLLVGFVATAAVQTGALSLDQLLAHFSRSGDASEVMTLTGRLEIWDFVSRKIGESPILGWGYNSSKEILAQHVGFENDLTVDTAHNMLLQVMLSVGIIGTLPAVALFVRLAIDFVTRPDPLRDLVFLLCVVTGATDSEALGTTPSLLTLLLFVASILPEGQRRKREVRALPLDRPAAPARFGVHAGHSVVAALSTPVSTASARVEPDGRRR